MPSAPKIATNPHKCSVCSNLHEDREGKVKIHHKKNDSAFHAACFVCAKQAIVDSKDLICPVCHTDYPIRGAEDRLAEFYMDVRRSASATAQPPARAQARASTPAITGGASQTTSRAVTTSTHARGDTPSLDDVVNQIERVNRNSNSSQPQGIRTTFNEISEQINITRQLAAIARANPNTTPETLRRFQNMERNMQGIESMINNVTQDGEAFEARLRQLNLE